MISKLTRRIFFGKIAAVSTGMAVLPLVSAFGTESQASKMSGYVPEAPEKSDLRNPGVIGQPLTVKGKVFCSQTGNIAPNVKIEVWHLSPRTLVYDHRATLYSDENGVYAFITDFPGMEAGKLPVIHFRVENNAAVQQTRVILGPRDTFITSDHWERNNGLGKKLFPKRTTQFNHSTLEFNVLI